MPSSAAPVGKVPPSALPGSPPSAPESTCCMDGSPPNPSLRGYVRGYAVPQKGMQESGVDIAQGSSGGQPTRGLRSIETGQEEDKRVEKRNTK